jgi:flagellar biosynthesis protein FlhA
MLTQFYPNVYVLAFSEIDRNVQIQALGNITLESALRTEEKVVNT